ncbi:DMT family transporter [Ruegeria sp. 2012CJ41-6]|uniref:DMT family transporter n=1 Tax=Ruegeria spongiae TaxID=2942209 RepID=A0ABT0PWI9_9RHOB|nr:DMT family transporter [Ruegeria spongiae]MCL6281969.1 DMT family transporter [Ruegeria spongiae]
MTGAIASFTLMAVSGRAAASTHDTFEIMMYRSLIGVIIVCAVLTWTRTWHRVSRDRLGLNMARNLAHFTGQNLWLYSLSLIPLAQLFALEFTTPLWVILLAPLLLGERITVAKMVAVGLGFLGILVVARPGAAPLGAGVITAASCAIFFALTMIATKRLTRSEGIGSILFWLTTMQLILGLLASGYDAEIALPTTATAPWLILIGICGLSAHFCLTNALSIAPATIVVPFDFARLPVIAIVGALFYHEPVDIWIFIGGGLILAANYINVRASLT